MNEHAAVIIGASGLIGSHLVEQILQDDDFGIVRILVRKRLPIIHPKLQQELVDFNDKYDYTQKFGEGDIIFCCIGTTQKKVKGDNTAYEKVDLDIAINAAKTGIEKGFKKFLIVSSVSANANSKNFYLKLKGKIENALKKFSFNSISIFRPGQLLGKRNEYRRGEALLQGITKFMSHFLFASLIKYHSIEAKYVAKALIEQSRQNNTGVHILEYKEMMNLIR
jgi:uncharacterized protein YbjT (DUF2867 family)